MKREWEFNLQLFAEEDRTQEATPRRREEARKRGQVARSPELGLAVGILGSCFLLKAFGPGMWQTLLGFTEQCLLESSSWQGGQADLMALALQTIVFMAKILAPLLAGLLLVSLAVNLAQVGFLVTGEGLTPKGERINPVEGFKRIFSKRSLFELGKSVVKVLIVGYLAYSVIRNNFELFLRAAQMPPVTAAGMLGAIARQIGNKVGLGFLVLAVADYFYQRFEHEKRLKMTIEEVKEELKQTEGSPQVRSRIRQRQRQMAMVRMMAEVPKADVVITNPTRLAVAIRYDPEKMLAPIVVAKGREKLAEKIRALAREHGVPIVENKPLAQALYRSVEVGQAIGPELYRAVAEILAFVYQLKGRSI